MMQEIVRQIQALNIIKGKKKFEEIIQEDWDKIDTPELRESIRK
jgi:hypothetical protein